jgi:hypothetical protein
MALLVPSASSILNSGNGRVRSVTSSCSPILVRSLSNLLFSLLSILVASWRCFDYCPSDFHFIVDCHDKGMVSSFLLSLRLLSYLSLLQIKRKFMTLKGIIAKHINIIMFVLAFSWVYGFFFINKIYLEIKSDSWYDDVSNLFHFDFLSPSTTTSTTTFSF